MLPSTAKLIDHLYDITAEEGTFIMRGVLTDFAIAADDAGRYHTWENMQQVKQIRDEVDDLADALSDLFGYEDVADEAYDLAAALED